VSGLRERLRGVLLAPGLLTLDEALDELEHIVQADLAAKDERIAELEAELTEAKADAERGWADAQRREDDGTMWAKLSRQYHEAWKAAEAERDRLRAAVERVRAAVERVRAAVERVRERHQRCDCDEDNCTTCWGMHDRCIDCDEPYPCPTIRALDQAPAEEAGPNVAHRTIEEALDIDGWTGPLVGPAEEAGQG
jgi:hypothetical protein